MVYRDTPIQATGASPSQLMMGRHLRTTLPVPSSTLEPHWPDRDTILERDKQYKFRASKYYDKQQGAKPLPKLQPGEPVLIKTDDQKGWKEKGIVKAEADTPRSYQIETKSGVCRRNRRHLRLLPPVSNQEKLQVQPPEQPPEQPPVKPLQPQVLAETESPEPIQVLRRSGRVSKKPERLTYESK